MTKSLEPFPKEKESPIEELPASASEELNLKKFLNDQNYRKEMTTSNRLLNSFFYFATLNELAAIFKNESLDLGPTQIEAIKKCYLPELKSKSPLVEMGFSPQEAENGINEDFAVAGIKSESAVPAEDEERTKELTSAAQDDNINLSYFEDNHAYRTVVLNENPHFARVAERERLAIIKNLIKNEGRLNLTLKQIEDLTALAGQEAQKDLQNEIQKISSFRERKEMTRLFEKKGARIQSAYNKLKKKYFAGKLNRKKFEVSVNELLKNKLGGKESGQSNKSIQ